MIYFPCSFCYRRERVADRLCACCIFLSSDDEREVIKEACYTVIENNPAVLLQHDRDIRRAIIKELPYKNPYKSRHIFEIVRAVKRELENIIEEATIEV